MWRSFEALLGRRYLMRSHRQPRVWYIGMAVLLLGALMAFGSSWILNSPGVTSSIGALFGGSEDSLFAQAVGTHIAQVTQGIGLGFVVIGVLVALFGFLLWWMTTFSAFSTFMIATGVAEVLLVLGVMNGFQGYLRSKLVDAHAHVSVLPPSGVEWLRDYEELAKELRDIEGVFGVSPVINTDVMLRVPAQEVSAAAKLIGVQVSSVDETIKLSQFLSGGCGCLGSLDDPSPLAPMITDPMAAYTYCARACPPPLEARKETDSTGLSSLEQNSDLKQDLMALPLPVTKRAMSTLFLGVHLRYSLGINIGQSLEVISPLGDIGPHGPMPKVRPFMLAGWANSGLAEVDAQQAYAALRDVQRFLGVGDVINEIRLRARDIEAARELRDRLRENLGERARVIDWRERNKGLFSALQLERIAMFLVLTINILLAAFSIVSTLVMNLIERRREIAILRAMGAEARSMRRVFVSQGLTAGIIGSALGVLIGGSACALLATFGLPLNAEEVYYISSIPVEVKPSDLLSIVFVALAVSLISTIYPARYAANIQPVEGVKGR